MGGYEDEGDQSVRAFVGTVEWLKLIIKGTAGGWVGYQIEGQIFNKFIIKVKRSHSHTAASLITSLIYLALILQRNTTGLGRLSDELQ